MKNVKLQIKEKIKTLPEAPGVYVMFGKGGEVLYVGKARSLRKRVSSYFTRSKKAPKIERLTEEVEDIKFYPAKSEVDALILELGFIKRYRPPFNTAYKDDKSYPFIKITKEPFPSVSLVRLPPSSAVGSLSAGHWPLATGNCILFGPFPKVKLVREALRKIRRIFPVRGCAREISDEKTTPACLDLQVGLCSGPCQLLISAEDYRVLAHGIYLLLKGEKKWLFRDLKRRMERLSKELRFEDAAKVRNQLLGLKGIVDAGQGENAAFFGGPSYKKHAGRMLEELKTALGLPGIPSYIEGLDISNIGGDYATGSVVAFKDGVPFKNGYRHFRIKTVRGSNDVEMLAEVAERRYKNSPQSIRPKQPWGETSPCLCAGRAVHSPQQEDDNTAQSSKLKAQSEKKSEPYDARRPTSDGVYPDLVLVDGGIAQLNAVAAKLKELNVKIPLASIAKKFEEVFMGGCANGKARKICDLSMTSPALHMLQNVRDEAHRFAIRYHKILRGRDVSKSVLDGIKGIGEKRKKALLSRFGSVDGIREASVRELKKIGIPEKISEEIIE